MKGGFSRTRVLVARVIALAADAVQVAIAPSVSLPGVGMALVDAIDLVVAVTMLLLLGWHWVFLPTVLAEGIPVVHVAPTLTVAVLFVTRKSKQALPAATGS
jgi:hypothetical protein